MREQLDQAAQACIDKERVFIIRALAGKVVTELDGPKSVFG